MLFVQGLRCLTSVLCFCQDRVAKMGLRALNLTMEFAEESVLQENVEYIASTLEV